MRDFAIILPRTLPYKGESLGFHINPKWSVDARELLSDLHHVNSIFLKSGLFVYERNKTWYRIY